MADSTPLLTAECMSNLPESKVIELDPVFKGNKKLIKHRRQNVTMASTSVLLQEREGVLTRLQEADELSMTFQNGG